MTTCACGHSVEQHEMVGPPTFADSIRRSMTEPAKINVKLGRCLVCAGCDAFSKRPPAPPWPSPADERNVWGASVAMPEGYSIDAALEPEEEFALCEMLATRVMDHAFTLGVPHAAKSVADGDKSCCTCGAFVGDPCKPTHDGERDASGTWSHPGRARANDLPTSARMLVEWASAVRRSDVIDFGGLSVGDVALAVRHLCDAIPAYAAEPPRQCDAVSDGGERCHRRDGHDGVHRIKRGEGGLVEWRGRPVVRREERSSELAFDVLAMRRTGEGRADAGEQERAARVMADCGCTWGSPCDEHGPYW